MASSIRSFSQYLRLASLIVVAAFALVSCGPGANQAAPSNPYESAKEAFKNNQLDKALDITEKLASVTPPGDFTDRARVLRVVIFSSELRSAKAMAEAYSKGSEKSKNPQFQTAYRRLHNDNLEVAARSALDLAETVHQIAPQGAFAKEFVLEANYPSVEGPTELPQVARIEQGAWIEPDLQESSGTDCLHKSVDDTLADVVSGDRAKARQELTGGSVTLAGPAFALFVATQLADGAEVFDRHHGSDSQKLKLMCEQGQLALKAAQDMLKATPDKDQEAAAKKLQDRFKTILKNT